MGQLTISNAPIQFINFLIYERSLNSFYEYNLIPEMFGPYEGLMRKVMQFTEEYKETPVIETVIEWDSDFYICYEIQDPSILARQMQVDYFYRTKFNKKLNECIDNVQINPEESMRELADFCMENTNIIYGPKTDNIDYIEGILGDYLENPPVVYKTKIDLLDDILNGGIMDELIVLGGFTGTFKTTLLQYVADNLAKQGHHVTYVSLEIPKKDLIFKSLSRELYKLDINLTPSDLKHGKYDKDTFNKIKNINKGFLNNITYLDSGDLKDLTIESVKDSIIADIMKNNGKSVVIVDYMQLIQSSNLRSDSRRTVDEVVGVLKQITSKHGCPVIAISSISRENYNGRITTKAFKESSSIEYTANVLIGLEYDESVYKDDKVVPEELKKWFDKDERGINLKILKNRDGQNEKTVLLNVKGSCCTFNAGPNIKPNRPERTKPNRPERPRPAQKSAF